MWHPMMTLYPYEQGQIYKLPWAISWICSNVIISDNSRLSEDSTLTHPGSKPAVISIKSETETPGKSDNEAELEGEEESEESDRDDSSFHKKRRLDGGEDEKPEEPPPPM